MNDQKNEGLDIFREGILENKQDRREFFKNMAKVTLPAIAIMGLGTFGSNLYASSKSRNRSVMDCKSSCQNTCTGECEGGCKGNVEMPPPDETHEKGIQEKGIQQTSPETCDCWGCTHECTGTCRKGCISCQGCTGSCTGECAGCTSCLGPCRAVCGVT